MMSDDTSNDYTTQLRAQQFAELTGGTHRGALLVVDVQRDFGDPAHLPAIGDAAVAAIAAAVDGVERSVELARASGVPVIWIELRVRPDDPWVSSNWFRGIAPGDPWPNEYEPCVDETPGADWYQVSPGDGEIVVSKRTYDGFFNTDLDAILREQGITWVTVVGLTSDCCVNTTAGSAFSRGYATVVLSDASAAYDPAAHEEAMHILSLHSAVVSEVDEIATVWSAAAESANPTGTVAS